MLLTCTKEEREGEGKEMRERKRLVMVPWPYQGHINPMLRLAGVLHQKGFSITVAHPKYNSPNSSDHPHFTFVPLDDGLPENGPPADFNFIQSVRVINSNVESSLRRELLTDDHDGNLREENIACIIYDSVLYKVDGVANELKIPAMVLQTGSAAGSLFHLTLPVLKENGYLPTRGSMALDAVPGLEQFRFKDLPIFNLHSHLDFILQIFATIADIKHARALILDTAECIDAPFLTQLNTKYTVPIFPVGPLHKMAPPSAASSVFKLNNQTGCFDWLDKQDSNSVIYVSFGTTVPIEKTELVETAFGLVNSEQKFLWVIRPGQIVDGGGFDLTELLPDVVKRAVGDGKGRIVEWVSQTEVLAHGAVGGFWSHCGWNSTVESISEGVPVLCRPQQWDQLLNAGYVSHVMKLGLTLEKEEVEREKIAAAIRRLMVGEESKEMRRRAADLKTKIEESVKRGGASSKAAADLADYVNSII